ncbi:ankyrin repeat domain-containing protein 27-like [Phlebotomus argentipes]|uniref:ankyrin repeat domain-containing protein 27-like n=1 Tax=Phlebotomus argentipes TaxID=94469 RepID=UPI0028933D7A|nr:ankyrin repeat domain-containing protein 27-like [Phlebotomus argentipes]
MDYEYDENLSVNDFYVMLKTKHQILLDTAPMENFVILIPRRGSLPDVKTLETDFILSHVLIPNDELPGSHFTTLMGEKVSVNVGGKRISVETAAGPAEALILFEEVIYTKDNSKYRVWCIDTPIGKSGSEPGRRKNTLSTDLYTILTSHDAGQLLANEINSQTVFKRIQAICREYVTVNSSQEFTMEQLRESIQALFNKCLKIAMLNNGVLKKKCRADAFFLRNVKLALETYIMSLLHDFVFDRVTLCYLPEAEIFNRHMRSASDLTFESFHIDQRFQVAMGLVRSELSRIEACTTVLEKMNCLKNALNVLPREGQDNSAVSSDEIIPVLAFAIVKSGLTHWITTLRYLKRLKFTSLCDNGVEDYLLTTLEAAMTFLEGGSCGKMANAKGEASEERITERFASREHFIEYFHAKVRENNENEVIRLMDVAHVEIESLNKRLCHPLCDCLACREVVGQSVPDVNCNAEDGKTALHVAAAAGPAKMVTLLIALGARVNVKDREGVTPLHVAARAGQQSTLLLLLHAGAKIDARTSLGAETPLHLAAVNGQDRCVKAILYFCDHMHVPQISINARNMRGETPLHLASRWGFASIVESLMEFGARGDVRNKVGITAIEASHNSHIRTLMQESLGASQSPQHSVRANGSPPEVKVEKIIDAIAQGDTNLALFYLNIDPSALANGTKVTCECAEPLCQCPKDPVRVPRGASVNLATEDGVTPLHAAIRYNNVHMTHILLAFGANPKAKTRSRWHTPLHFVATGQEVDAVVVFLDHTTKDIIDDEDIKGNTALHLALLASNLHLVELLLKYNPDVTRRNCDGQRPIDVARSKMLCGIVQQLENLSENTEF